MRMLKQSQWVLALAAVTLLALTSCSSPDPTVSTTADEGETSAPDETGIDDPVAIDEPLAPGQAIDDGLPAGPIDMDALTSGTWTLLFGSGPDGQINPVDGYPLTITFDGDGSFGGTASCNGYGGTYQFDGPQIFLRDLAWTEMACEPTVQAAEGAFLSALQDVTDINLIGDELALSGMATELIFSQTPLASLEPLWGMSFALEALLVDGEPTAPQGDETILAVHPNDSITATTGCRTLEAALVVSGDQLIATDSAATGECPSALVGQDGHIIEVLGDGFRYEFDGENLLISSAGNIGLHYRNNIDDGLVVDAPDAVVGSDGMTVSSTQWHFVGGDGPNGVIADPASVDSTATITLLLADGEFSGDAICNWYGGSSQLDEFLTEVVIGIPEGSKRGCGDGLDEIVAAYFEALPLTTDASLDNGGTELILTSSDTELRFQKAS